MSETMKLLGFTKEQHYWINKAKRIRTHFGKGASRPYYASRIDDKGRTEYLHSHGDMLFSGRLRKFATPEAAAKAALETWS